MTELAQRIGIDDAQVRYWFQNRHTRTKLRMEEYENKLLREENDMIMQENMANLDFLRRHMYCSRCLNGGMTVEELRMENIWLRKELARVIAHVEDVSGQPIVALLSVVPDETSSPPPASSATTDDFLSLGPPNHV
ncbi:hypothetical protein QJS10_CPB15g00697 [Acorus calamus]|uniref:Homeobox domain-containing protein n=1 Tax=Acorus calamus TaxID=4465 RepID=A0AAV9D3B2_ACOCL|nr:hypothetical protein QJS10_CPB15g00697 [Acorus calamus]